MFINDVIPIEACFYSDFAEETREQCTKAIGTIYKLHVYDTSMPCTYNTVIDSNIVYKHFMSNVLHQIAIDGIATVLVTTKYSKCIYIIVSDD